MLSYNDGIFCKFVGFFLTTIWLRKSEKGEDVFVRPLPLPSFIVDDVGGVGEEWLCYKRLVGNCFVIR